VVSILEEGQADLNSNPSSSKLRGNWLQKKLRIGNHLTWIVYFGNLQEVSLKDMLALEPIDNWIIKTQARNHKTLVYSNEHLDEITNAKCDTYEEEQNLSMYNTS
jgi:hypothetical protein